MRPMLADAQREDNAGLQPWHARNLGSQHCKREDTERFSKDNK